MNKTIKKNSVFLFPFLVIWIILAVVLIIFPKADIHLFLNRYHSSVWDFIFTITTFLGDGATPAVIGVLFLFISFRKGFIIGTGAIFSGVFAQSLKQLVFPHVLRPKAYFDGIAELYFVPNIEIHNHFSFPSGHTTTAFCLFFILSYFVENKYLKLLGLIVALMAGYSRIYLSQHFLIDVYFGALFGVLSALLSIAIFSGLNKTTWLDKSILTILKRK